LNAIIGYSEMLAEDAEDSGDQSVVNDLGKILSSGRHLLGLINDVLDLSKIEAGRMELYAESFSVATLLEEVGATVTPMLNARGNELGIDCPEDVHDMYSDLTKVRQILTNLLSNAVKFTTNGRIELAVARRQLDGYDSLVFSVSDTGIGMTEEQLERVFEVFAQADASTTREYGGTGLGLAISRKLTDLLSGEISVASSYGEGTTFRVELPLRLEVAAGEEEAVPRPQPPPPEKIGRTETSVDPDEQNTVLLIDDDAHARELLGIYLQRSGWHVITAADALSGIEMAREVEPTVIIHDIMMPGMDGWSLLDVLKNDAQLRDIPVIVCSVLDEPGRGIAQGAIDYLVKPVDKQELIQTLERFKIQI
jgi:CheY-like chemotaxis protein/two-component sensor histidine kinase